MKFEDKGFLISKNKYNENSAIAEFYTENHGKVSGLIFGASSVKIKSFLLAGNLFNIQFNSKISNRAGYFKVEIEKVYTPHFLDNKIKLSCILYSLNLIKILTVENQSNKNIFNQLFNLYALLNTKNWIKNFIFWELEIIKLVGYDINFSNYINHDELKNDQSHFLTSDGSKSIPSFLIKNSNNDVNNDELKDGLKLVGDFLNKSVLIPNNINYPLSRNEFIKLI